MIRRNSAVGGTLRYVQAHRYESDLEEALRQSRGTVAEPYTGHAELWIDRAHGAGPEQERAGQEALEDERHFIDFSRSTIFFGKELTFIDRRW